MWMGIRGGQSDFKYLAQQLVSRLSSVTPRTQAGGNDSRNSCHPWFGLTLLGCVTPPVCVRGVTEERRDHKLL